MRMAGLPDNDATRAALEKQMISGEVVRQAAEKANYADRPEVKQVLTAARAKAVSELYLRDNAKPATVTDQQVKARYDQMAAQAGSQEYKPRVISVADDATAGQVLAKLKSGQSFDDLARQYSQASNRAAGGEMGWVTFKTPVTDGQTGGLPLPLAQAIAQLKAGGYTQAPVTLGTSRVIVKLDAVRPTQILPYDKVKDAIRQQLEASQQQQATDALVGKLTKDAKIER
ncbi:peptidyl-prolyl cis-trans isomerase [Dyella acidisoli]